ncbi:MAG: MATE family efflux transporter [Christensenellales bacterium]|jgi:putative MATE family efflux protein
MIAGTKHQDLTEGPIFKKLMLFFLPMLAGSLFQQLYTTLDAVIVGQFAGKSGLAAIDAVYSLIKLPTNFMIGLSAGATIIISQYFGAKKQEDLRKAVHTAVAFAFTGGALLSAVGIALAPLGLQLMHVPDDLYAETLAYVRIIFSGLAGVMTYNIGAGILRAVGNSRTPFFYLVAASAINTALDFLFVGAWKMGVAGAALSTALAQWLSAALVLRALMRTDSVCKVTLRRIRFHRDTLATIFRLGVPVAMQSSLYPVANMTIQSSINRMGTDSIAAWALCGKLDFMFWLVVDAMGITVSTFAAQNYGAKRFARIHKGVRASMGAALLLTALISAGLYFGYAPLSRLFLRGEDLRILPLVGELMRLLAPLYVLYIFSEVFSGVLHGAGETVRPMLLKLIGTCAFRILWCCSLCRAAAR